MRLEMSRVEQWNVVKSPRFLWHRFLLTWNVIGRRPSAAIWKRRLLQSNATGDVKYFQFEWFYPSPTITQSRQEFDKYWQPYLDLGRGISYACAFSLLFPTYRTGPRELRESLVRLLSRRCFTSLRIFSPISVGRRICKCLSLMSHPRLGFLR